MRAAYSSQTQAHLGSDAEYGAIKSSGGTSWRTHTRAQEKAQKHNDYVNHMLMYSREGRHEPAVTCVKQSKKAVNDLKSQLLYS